MISIVDLGFRAERQQLIDSEVRPEYLVNQDKKVVDIEQDIEVQRQVLATIWQVEVEYVRL